MNPTLCISLPRPGARKDEDERKPAGLLTSGEPPVTEAFGAFSLSEARTGQLTLDHVP